MKTLVTIVRHGQSTGNAANCFTGQTDVALSALGEQQALATAQTLANEQFTAIYASDLQRAQRTAEIIAQPHNLIVQTLPALREINLGQFQGEHFAQIAQDYPQEFAALSRRDLDVMIPGGESHRQVRTRVVTAFQEMLAQHLGGHLLIVVHGGVIFHLNHHILGISEERNFAISYKIGNCSIHRYERLEELCWRVLTLNEEAHLKHLNLATPQQPSDFHTLSERFFGCS